MALGCIFFPTFQGWLGAGMGGKAAHSQIALKMRSWESAHKWLPFPVLTRGKNDAPEPWIPLSGILCGLSRILIFAGSGSGFPGWSLIGGEGAHRVPRKRAPPLEDVR